MSSENVCVCGVSELMTKYFKCGIKCTRVAESRSVSKNNLLRLENCDLTFGRFSEFFLTF